MTPQNPAFPASVDVEYPPRLSRLLIFVKWLLVIPHYIVLFVLVIGLVLALIASWFAVLFTGRYPEGLFNYVVGVLRWATRVVAYQMYVTDAYPPFSLADDPSYPVRVEVEYPAQIARWRPLVSWLLVIPALIGLYVIVLIAYVASFLAWFAILFTGRYPQGLFNAVVVGLRWSIRVNMYHYWMTERYPPFVWA